MKRKLLWVAVMFALGEVTYLFADGVIQISIMFIMLICCVKKQEKISLQEKVILLVSFVTGIGNIYFEDSNDWLEKSLYDGNAGYSVLEETDDYYISCYKKNNISYLVTGEATVIDILNGGTGNNYVLKFDYLEGDFGELKGESKMIAYGAKQELVLGKKYLVSGELNLFDNQTNPGSFDMRTYYKAEGIDFYLNKCSFTETARGEKISLIYKYKHQLIRLNKYLGEKFESFVSTDYVGLYKSILLGDKKGISTELKSLYRVNGIAHILAISGLHISLIGGLIYKLFRRLGIGFFVSGTASICIIVSYGIMTGNSNSTIRAVIMLALSIIGEIVGRNYDMLTGMALALVILLLINPYKLYDGGVILSFVAIVGVAVGRYITNIIFSKSNMKKIKKKKPYIYKIINLFIMTFSVNSMTLPIVSKLYYEIPLYSVFINLIVIPLFTPVVFLGLVALFISFFDNSLARVVIMPGEKIFGLYDKLCSVVMQLPYSNINIGKINLLQIIIYYFMVLIFLCIIRPDSHRKIRDKLYRKTGKWLEKKNLYIFIYGVYFTSLACVFSFIYLWNKESKNECVCFLDVGQGDGILIRSESGINIIIDGGSSSEENVGEYVIAPALKYMGMANVDYWFITHADLDHVSGLLYILETGKSSGISIKNIVVSKYIFEDEISGELIELASDNEVDIMYMDAGTSIMGKDFIIKAVFPHEGFVAEDKNQASLVLEYTTNNMSMLFTGDIDEKACENVYRQCINNGKYLYDVLKVPHHGSKYSVSTELYSLFFNGYGVISCGENNMYGHPHDETLSSLSGNGINILITKYMGAIVFNGY